jgi:hypothetical protein
MAGSEKVAELYIELQLADSQLQAKAKENEKALEGIGKAGQKAKAGVDDVGKSTDEAALTLGKYTIAAGAMAAALGIVTARASQLATEVRNSVVSITSASGALNGQTEAVRNAIVTVSRETNRSLEELGKTGIEIARNGVGGIVDFTERLRVASALSRTTATDFSATATGLDLVLDVFNIAPGAIGAVAEQLFRLSQNQVPLDDLFRTLQRAAPALQDFGIGFDTAAAAVSGLLLRGEDARQVAQRFKEIAERGEEGAAEIRALAAEARAAAGDFDSLAESTERWNDAMGPEGAKTRTEVQIFLENYGRQWNAVKEKIAGALNAFNDFNETVQSQSLNLGEKLSVILLGSDPDAIRRAKAGPVAVSSPIVSSAPGAPVDTPAAIAARAAAAKKAAEDAARNIERLRQQGIKAAQDISQAASKALNEVVGGPVGELLDTSIALREQLALVKPLGDAAFAKAKTDAETAFRAAILAVEEFAKAPKELPGGGNLSGNELTLKQIDTAKQLKDLRAASAAQQGADERQIAEQAEGHNRDRLDALTQQAQLIDQGVLAALDLAAAFGIADQNILGMLSSLSQISTGISPLVEALKTGTGGDILGAALPVAGGIASLIGGLSAAFGESPELKAARESLDKLREELEQNTQTLREINLSGSEISGTNSAIDQFIEQGLPRLRSRSRISTEGVESELEKFGLTLADIENLASELNVPFIDLTRETIPQFLAMLEAFGIELDEITAKGLFDLQTPQGRLDKFSAGVTFSDETETVGEILKGMLEAAAQGAGGASFLSPFFAAFKFEDLDSSDPAVKAAAEAAARGIMESVFGAITAEGFDPEQLGGFTADEFLAFLEQLLGVIPETIEDVADEVETAADRFAKAMGGIERAAAVFDLTDLEVAGQRLQAMADAFPGFADAIAGIDLSTTEGINSAIVVLQDYFSAIEDGTVTIEGAGFGVDDLVSIIDLLQGASRDAADEVERLAEEERRRSDELRRANDQNYREEQQRRAEEEREAQRAHEEALRRAEERRRLELAVGSDTLRALEESFALFDVDDLTAQLQARFTALSTLSPAFGGIVGGLDANSAGDRAEALSRLREFQLQNPFGVESGELSADVVRSQVLDLAELIKELNQVTVTSEGSIGSFAIDRSITELRGERLEGLLATGNIWLEDIAGSNAAIRDLLYSSFGGLSAPQVPAAFALASSSALVGTLIIQLPGSPDSVINGPAGFPSIAQLAAEIARYLAGRDLGAS